MALLDTGHSFVHSYSFIKVSDIMQQPDILDKNTINASVKSLDMAFVRLFSEDVELVSSWADGMDIPLSLGQRFKATLSRHCGTVVQSVP